MRNIIYKITACSALVALTLTGCKDSFLDEDPNGYISSGQIKENAEWNPNIMLGQALGTYSTTFAWQSGGTTNHDDFGQKSIDIVTDLMSGDLAMSGETYGWFSDAARLQCNTMTKNRAYMLWRYYYRIIKACNEIFDTVGGDEIPPENEDNKNYYAQAKALRAHSYFNLVNLYAKSYEIDKNAKALPLYRSQATAETLGLSTVEEIYDRVITDLKDAITILEKLEEEGIGRSNGTKDQIDQWTAKGILAYVYLTKGDYENAAAISADVIENSGYPLMSQTEIIESGFNNVSIGSWMWAFDITKDNSAGLPTFWGQVDYFSYSYCSAGDYKMIDQNLYNEIPASDTRKKWFHPSVLISWYKFYDAGRVAMGNRTWTNDIVYMRVEEMYLINAEANARANHLTEARASLKALLDERDEATAATLKDMNADELLDNIYYNWRVEMWAEGRGLLTLKRFHKSMVRGENNYALTGQTIASDDSRLVFEIPEREITNNPNLQK